MIDQTELLSREVPAEPGTLPNKGQVQQKEFGKHPNKEQIWNFKEDFISFYSQIGGYSWTITLFYLICGSVSCFNEHLSPTCPCACKNNPITIYYPNFSFDLHAFVSENETNYAQESELIWRKPELTYGDLQSVFSFSTNLSVSEVGPL